MAISAAQQAEIQRKANAGIALTNPTAATTAAYNAAQAAIPKTTTAVTTPIVSAPTTSPTSAAVPGAMGAVTSAVAPQVKTTGVAAAVPGGSIAPVTPMANAATATTNPALGYGGATYGSNTAATASIAANGAKLATDPAFKQSEIARTQAVIAARKAQGLDTSEQEKYLTQNLGYQNSSSADPYALSLDSIKARAQAEADAKLAALQSSYDATAKQIQGRYDYQQANTRDDRTLQDGSFYRNNAPTAWDGSTGYQAAQVDRNRSIADTYTGMALQDSLASAYAPVSDYKNNMSDLTNSRIDELTQQERSYGLDYANTYGQSATGQKTAAQSNADRDYNLQVDQQKLNNTQVMAALTGYMPDGTPTTQQQQIQLSNLWTAAEQTGTIPDALADLYGLPKGTQTQAAKQFAQNLQLNKDQLANAQAGTALDYEKYNHPTTGTGTTYTGLTPKQIYDAIKTQYTDQILDEDGKNIGSKLTSDPAKRTELIKQLIQTTQGLSDAQTEQLAASLGVTSKEWKVVTGHGLGE